MGAILPVGLCALAFCLGFLACHLTAVKRALQAGRLLLAAELTSSYKTVERNIGKCTCGTELVIIEIVPIAVSLDAQFSPKTVYDPAARAKVQQFRSVHASAAIK